MTAATHAERDGGFTLVELVISIVLSSIVAGVVVAIMVTSLNLVDATTDISHDATDAGLIAAFLYRDAQAAGGTDPLTLAELPELGVSTTDWGSCEQDGELVVRFSWVDREDQTAEHPMVVSWALLDDTRFVRRACQDGLHADVPLGEHIAAATAACRPGPACDATTDTVELTINGSAASSPTAFTLSATLRPDVPIGALPGGIAAPLLLLGDGQPTPTCPELTLDAGRVVVLGDALIDAACGAGAIAGTPELLEASGSTATIAELTDPLAGVMPAAPDCTPTTDPAFGTSPSADSTVVHTQPVVVTGTVAMQPGHHVLCQGIEIQGGGRLTGSDVTLHAVGGDVVVAGGATLDLSAPTSGALAGMLFAVDQGDVSIAGGSAPLVLRGAVHVPAGTLTIEPGLSVAAGAIVADRLTTAGAGPLRLGLPIPTIAIEPIELAPAQVDAAYPAVEMLADAGTAPYSWQATGLPTGLSMTSGGLLTGTPSASGTFDVTITVVDATGLAAVEHRALEVNPPVTITTADPLPEAQVGVAHSTTVTAAGGTPPYSFTADGLPAGLAIDSAGSITGTPTAAGTAIVSVTVTDAIYATADRTYSLTVRSALAITGPASLPNGTAGTAWSSTSVTAGGGLAPYAFSATGLPPGLTISAAGTISGTPTAAGTYSIDVTVTDAASATATRTYTVTIAAASTSAVPFGGNGGFQLLVEGNATIGVWDVDGAAAVGGNLKTGQTYQRFGVVETSGVVAHSGGQPLALAVGGRVDLTGSSTTTDVTVTKGWFTVGNTTNQSLLTFNGTLHLVPTGQTDSWTPPRVRTVLQQGASLPASNPVVPNAFNVAAAFSTLRTTSSRLGGLSTATCPALGTPTVSEAYGNHTVTLQASKVNVWNLTVATIQSMNNVDGPVRPGASTPLVINVLDPGAVTVPLRWWQLLIADPASPSAVLWNFPNATSVSVDTSIIGSVLAPNAALTMTNLEVKGDVVAKTFSLSGSNARLAHFTHVVPCLSVGTPYVSTPGSMPTGQVSTPIATTTFTAGGGSAPYTWSATGLPSGLTLSAAGVLSGTPTAAGSFTVTVTVTDAAAVASTRTYVLTVNALPSISAPDTLPDGKAGTPYASTTLTVSGGTGPYSWGASGLPAGLSMSTSGTITGVPTTPTSGQATVTVTVTDATGTAATRAYGVVIAAAPVPAGCPIAPVGWRGEYYANATLSGSPSLCRDDPAVSFNWNGTSPGGSVPATNFSARWTLTQWFAAGTWQFTKGSDDGLRVYVDSTLVIDDWNYQVYSANDVTAEVELTEGYHTVIAEYFQGPGDSRVQLDFTLLDETPCGDPTTSTWVGEYYANKGLAGNPVLCRNDSTINFDWGQGSPAPAVPSDSFSVRWTREVSFAQSGTYRFSAGSDDGVRLYVDGVQVIDHWFDRVYGVSTVDLALTAGMHTIAYEFYENWGYSRATLTWQQL